MRIDKQVEATEARKGGDGIFRLMLREVKPEHVPDMIHTLWLFGHGGRGLMVPDNGRWRMTMPHGYTLVREGRVGVTIEPPRGQAAMRADKPDDGDHFQMSQPTVSSPKLDEHDTQGVIALCDQARHTAQPERGRVISQLFALRLERCRPRALDAVELLIYELVVSVTE